MGYDMRALREEKLNNSYKQMLAEEKSMIWSLTDSLCDYKRDNAESSSDDGAGASRQKKDPNKGPQFAWERNLVAVEKRIILRW